MEKVGTLAYSVDNAYTYDATDASNDEYEALNTEKQISDDLYSLCLMENFVDYGIVYRNNHTVGKISNGTTTLFGENLFSDLDKMVTRERTHDGWYTGYGDSYERIYYVKRIHENALFCISFYTSELDGVFENPDNLEDMEIRLTDGSYKMIYSSEKDELGSKLPDNLLEGIDGFSSGVNVGKNDLVSVDRSSGSWYVICSIPTAIILKEAGDMKLYILLAAIVAAILAVGAGAVFIRRIADPVATVTSGLSAEIREDGFEGVLGNRYFRDKCQSIVNKTSAKEQRAVVLMEVDDFTGLIAKIGRDEADKQLTKMLLVIGQVFRDAEVKGRVAESTFAVLTRAYKEDEADGFRGEIERSCDLVCKMFAETITTSTMGTLKVTATVGAGLYPLSGSDYTDVYDSALTALDEARAQHKGSYTIKL
ncbi:MAG: diguanylate cyclase [Ruminococcus sp.]|nr:diguanylate cyclase [Ruminococcus sp.]